ncbi:hypothetical protein PG985_008732 [Apiospora marii]|uniref:uncharacterized protein n=1 Tax=Apiospora marii TaxID=335849 RepID=UPI00312EA262
MSSKVINSTLIKAVVIGGRSVNVKYATKTACWKRTFLDEGIQARFLEVVENAEVPAGAKTAIMTETEHPSKKGSYPHYTTVFQDANGNDITTKHLYP